MKHGHAGSSAQTTFEAALLRGEASGHVICTKPLRFARLPEVIATSFAEIGGDNCYTVFESEADARRQLEQVLSRDQLGQRLTIQKVRYLSKWSSRDGPQLDANGLPFGMRGFIVDRAGRVKEWKHSGRLGWREDVTEVEPTPDGETTLVVPTNQTSRPPFAPSSPTWPPMLARRCQAQVSAQAPHAAENSSALRNHEIALCGPTALATIYQIINQSALAYKGVIPADCWHDPYMPMDELTAEIAHGVRFYGYRTEDRLVGVMGIQDMRDVTLIRHAYVRTKYRGQGIGGKLLAHLNQLTARPVLIGTWKAAAWAIRFYEQNGFGLVSDDEKKRLLKTYWSVPERQIEESIVLADPRWRERDH